jgi:hypothetical protein
VPETIRITRVVASVVASVVSAPARGREGKQLVHAGPTLVSRGVRNGGLTWLLVVGKLLVVVGSLDVAATL